jgi:DNA-binding XRE family transcriptional regulator
MAENENKIIWPFHPDFVSWNRLKMLRKMKQVRQVDLAAACDVSFPTLYFLENGAERRVSQEIKKRIADFFQVDVSDIFPAMMSGEKIVETAERVPMRPFEKRVRQK